MSESYNATNVTVAVVEEILEDVKELLVDVLNIVEELIGGNVNITLAETVSDTIHLLADTVNVGCLILCRVAPSDICHHSSSLH